MSKEQVEVYIPYDSVKVIPGLGYTPVDFTIENEEVTFTLKDWQIPLAQMFGVYIRYIETTPNHEE